MSKIVMVIVVLLYSTNIVFTQSGQDILNPEGRVESNAPEELYVNGPKLLVTAGIGVGISMLLSIIAATVPSNNSDRATMGGITNAKLGVGITSTVIFSMSTLLGIIGLRNL